MRIKTIEINNYKAFYGKHRIKVNGKNLFMYGENGSGKSSLYYALKDFFQSSSEEIDLSEVENIFIKDAQKGNCYIKVTFNPNSKREKRNQDFEFTMTAKNTDSAADTSIRDANKLKSFLTYKNLLDIHHIKKHQRIDLFNLLVNGVLKHFKFPLLGDKELGQLWQDVDTKIKKETSRSYNITDKRKEVDATLKTFNDAFGELFNESSPEYILKHAGPILDEFKHNIDLRLSYSKAKPDSDYRSLENNHVYVELRYAGKKVKKPHLFLNEARLSAIAISIYLGMIKRHIQLLPCKILFLDDIFIGLDIANRLPLLKILKTQFTDYQLFITTYDKPWYEYAKSCLEGTEGWLTLEFYAQETKEGFEFPMIFDNQELIKKALWHHNNSDYKAAAVYARSAFEKILRTYCHKKNKKIAFKPKMKDYSTQDFWNEVLNDIEPTTKSDIEQYRDLVLNPYSHYNTEKHEIKTELRDAIEAVKKLKSELDNL
jgi:energy-coupling factor transporter ATP-binding protein EcfA2